MRRRLSFAFLSLLALTVSASAAPVKATFSATVTSVLDDLGVGVTIPGWSFGSLLTTTVFYDTESADAASDPSYGIYAMESGPATLNGAAFGTLEGRSGQYNVNLITPADQSNAYFSWYTYEDFPDGSSDVESTYTYFGGANLVLDDAQKNLDYLLANSTTNFINYNFTHYDAVGNGTTSQISGAVQSVTVEAVPEPASLAALGLGALAVVRRKLRSRS